MDGGSIIGVPKKNVVSITKEAATGGNQWLSSQRGSEHEHQFDCVYEPTCSQQEVYEWSGRPLVVAAVAEGRNATILVYGATGAGKTHTMFGSEGDRGMVHRALEEVFSIASGIESLIAKVSFLEIYNDKVEDLLQEGGGTCDIREDARNQYMQINGLQEVPVASHDEALMQLQWGMQQRKVEATAANARSSRSHAIFQLKLERIDSGQLHSKLCLIDLAGSERASQTKNVGKALLDGAKINTSLLALAECIKALADEKKKDARIPFYNSKLTRLLKYSFKGDGMVSMIACIHPGREHYEDSHNTVIYAKHAAGITVEPTVIRRPAATPQRSVSLTPTAAAIAAAGGPGGGGGGSSASNHHRSSSATPFSGPGGGSRNSEGGGASLQVPPLGGGAGGGGGGGSFSLPSGGGGGGSRHATPVRRLHGGSGAGLSSAAAAIASAAATATSTSSSSGSGFGAPVATGGGGGGGGGDFRGRGGQGSLTVSTGGGGGGGGAVGRDRSASRGGMMLSTSASAAGGLAFAGGTVAGAAAAARGARGLKPPTPRSSLSGSNPGPGGDRWAGASAAAPPPPSASAFGAGAFDGERALGGGAGGAEDVAAGSASAAVASASAWRRVVETLQGEKAALEKQLNDSAAERMRERTELETEVARLRAANREKDQQILSLLSAASTAADSAATAAAGATAPATAAAQ